MDLVFATNNKNKLAEIRQLVGDRFNIISLAELGCFDEIPETGETIEENARQKSMYIYSRYNVNCFADDTGLEVDALNGAPGVYTARYAGEHCTPEDNVQKMLREMKGKDNRNACFRTVISLILDGKEYQFEGRVDGFILNQKQGEKGFGYDPIFGPKGYDCSFAELEMADKNKISHRGLATQKLVDFLLSR